MFINLFICLSLSRMNVWRSIYDVYNLFVSPRCICYPREVQPILLRQVFRHWISRMKLSHHWTTFSTHTWKSVSLKSSSIGCNSWCFIKMSDLVARIFVHTDIYLSIYVTGDSSILLVWTNTPASSFLLYFLRCYSLVPVQLSTYRCVLSFETKGLFEISWLLGVQSLQIWAYERLSAKMLALEVKARQNSLGMFFDWFSSAVFFI